MPRNLNSDKIAKLMLDSSRRLEKATYSLTRLTFVLMIFTLILIIVTLPSMLTSYTQLDFVHYLFVCLMQIALLIVTFIVIYKVLIVKPVR